MECKYEFKSKKVFFTDFFFFCSHKVKCCLETSLEVWFYNESQKWNYLLMLHNSFKTVTMKLHGLLSILDVYYKK